MKFDWHNPKNVRTIQKMQKMENPDESQIDIFRCIELAMQQLKKAEDILTEKALETSIPEETIIPLKPKDFLFNGPWWIRSLLDKYYVAKLVLSITREYVITAGIEDTVAHYYDNLAVYYERSNDGINWQPCYVAEDKYELSY